MKVVGSHGSVSIDAFLQFPLVCQKWMPSRRRLSFPWSKSLLLSKFHFSMSSCHLVPFLFACLKSRSEIYVCHSLWHIGGHLNYSWNETYASASSAVSQQGLHIKGYMNYHLSSKSKDIPSQFSSSFLPSKNPQKTLSQNPLSQKCNKPCHWFHWKHRQFGKWSWSMSVMCDMFRKCSPQ